MASQNVLPRGFKSKAEKIALDFRKQLNLLPRDPLCGFMLAQYLKIPVYSADEIFPSGTNLDELLGTSGKDKGWSALTMQTNKNPNIIVHNPLHALSRQQSNLMHELAHIICKHEKPTPIENVNLPFFMRDFNMQQEEEANCLGSTLQITREGLIWALKNRLSNDEIADHFNASPAMVNKRINLTGVKRQLHYLFI